MGGRGSVLQTNTGFEWAPRKDEDAETGGKASNEGGGREEEDAKRPVASSAEAACTQNDDGGDDDGDGDGDSGEGFSAETSSADITSASTAGGSACSMPMQSSSVFRASPLSQEPMAHCNTSCNTRHNEQGIACEEQRRREDIVHKCALSLVNGCSRGQLCSLQTAHCSRGRDRVRRGISERNWRETRGRWRRRRR